MSWMQRFLGSKAPDRVRNGRRRLFIFDFQMVGFSGHEFNQLLGFQEAAKALGLDPFVFVLKSAGSRVVRPLDARAVLPHVLWHLADRDTVLDSLAEGNQALREVWGVIETLGVTRQDILFFTQPRPPVIYALGQWLDTLSPTVRPAVFFRFFGPEFLNFQTMDPAEKGWVYRFVAKELASKRGEERVFFTLNNRKLLDTLERLCLRRTFFMPVPKYHGNVDSARTNTQTHPTTIYVHANRLVDMPERINAIAHATMDRRTDVKFLVRFCKYADEEAAAHALIDEKLLRRGLELLPAEESTQHYLAAFERSDVVVLPYEPVEYRALASGVFCEAVGRGKVVVVPNGTWMADQVVEGRAAGVLFDKPTAGDIAGAVESALRDLPRLQQEALRCAGPYREENSCRRNLELMLDLARSDHDMRLAYVPPANYTGTFDSRNYLHAGWSSTEVGLGVWTDGPIAELVFQRRPTPLPLILRARLNPLLAPAHPEICVGVSANGRMLTQWRFSAVCPEDVDWPWREATIPADVVSNGEIRVTLHIDRPVSPWELGMSSDRRRLGVMLRELELRPAG